MCGKLDTVSMADFLSLISCSSETTSPSSLKTTAPRLTMSLLTGILLSTSPRKALSSFQLSSLALLDESTTKTKSTSDVVHTENKIKTVNHNRILPLYAVMLRVNHFAEFTYFDLPQQSQGTELEE